MEMEANERPWFEKLTVTPLITHAVEVLRSAIPQGAVKISVSIDIDSGQTEFDGASLTEEQTAAAWMLVAVAAYHRGQMVAAYGTVISEDDDRIPQKMQAAQEHFEEDVRRKLNIEMDGFVFNGLSGILTVFA
jgi:uncharacterized membrane protein